VNKFIAIAAAGVVAIVASVSMTAPSSAFYPGAGLAAGFVGFALGAAVADSADRDYGNRYDRGYGYRDHVEACEDAYQSYDPRTDTYMGYDGYAHVCRL
jgi:hypothetical protein